MTVEITEPPQETRVFVHAIDHFGDRMEIHASIRSPECSGEVGPGAADDFDPRARAAT